MTQHPNPRAAIENLWDRATPVEPLLDAYRDQVLTEAAEMLRHYCPSHGDVESGNAFMACQCAAAEALNAAARTGQEG